MSTNANGKRDRDALVIAALAAGSSYAEAARVGRVSKATVARRMAEPAFRGEVNEARDHIIDQVRGLLTTGSLSAAETLLEVATDGSSESARVAAASRVIDIALRRRPGFDTYTLQEVSAIVQEIVEVSIRGIPEEAQEAYLREIRAIGAS
jgi:hypothetical protein